MNEKFCTKCNAALGPRTSSEFCRKHYQRDAIKKSEYDSKYNKINEDRRKATKADYYQRNSEKIRERAHAQHLKDCNTEWFKKRKAKYEKNKRSSDPQYRLRGNLRSLIRMSFKLRSYSKKTKTFQLIGLDFETLKNHLEYTWFQNYGTDYAGESVHIDHIVPCSTAGTEAELITLQHWTNLQYLTPEDNQFKSDRCSQ